MSEIMTKPNYALAKRKAEELLKIFDIKEPIVPVFEMAKALGLQIKFIQMPPELGAAAGFIDKEHQIIYVNDDDAAFRKTFTVAHELGHFVLDHKPNEIKVLLRLTAMQTTSVEKEANCFASNLLVPENTLKELMKRYNLQPTDSEIIAKIFGVSKEVITYRLERLGMYE